MSAIQQVILGYGAASTPSGVTWNPADKDSLITLSGGDLLATRSGSDNSWRSVRATTSRNAGKLYFEIVNTTSVSTGMMAGIGTSAAALTSYPGAGTTSWGFHANASGSETYHNGSSSNSGGSQVGSGSYARIAVDLDAGKLWLGTSGSWEGGGDPASGTSPTYSFTPGIDLFPMLGMYKTNQACTLRAAAGAMGGSIPSGFSAWQ